MSSVAEGILLYQSQAKARPVSANPCAACGVRDRTLCAAVEPEELELINAIVTKIEREPEVTVFVEGEVSDSLYNVTRGVVRISKLLPDGRRQITGFMFPGDLLGLAHGDSYVYTAESVTSVGLCRLPRRKLEVLFRRVPNLERRLLAVTSHELAAAQDQLLLLGRKSAREKLSTFLLMMQEGARRRGESDNPIELAMSWSDIADYIGMSHEHVSRTLRELIEDGYIRRVATRSVVIVREDTLRDMAEGNDEI